MKLRDIPKRLKALITPKCAIPSLVVAVKQRIFDNYVFRNVYEKDALVNAMLFVVCCACKHSNVVASSQLSKTTQLSKQQQLFWHALLLFILETILVPTLV